MHSTDLHFYRKVRIGIKFQGMDKSWADIKFSLEWIQNTLKAGNFSENRKEFVLFCDNLSSHISEEFVEAGKSINGIAWFSVSGASNVWQPVDCGIGRILKQLVSRIQEECLEHDDNIDWWLGNSEQRLDAKRRLILITHWFDEDYGKLLEEDYKHTRYRSIKKTGFLITTDGSED